MESWNFSFIITIIIYPFLVIIFEWIDQINDLIYSH